MTVIPGIFLIVLGVVVFIEPQVLVWLAAAVLIMIGTATLMISRFIRGSREDD